MTKGPGINFEYEESPLRASGWQDFFGKNIRGFRGSQYDNVDYFESFEKILKVLNTTNERVAGIVTSDFSEDAYTKNESDEITLSKELQEAIVKRLSELLAQPRGENLGTVIAHALPTLETMLAQIKSFGTKTREQWITHFYPEGMAISDKIFDKIVRHAIRIIIRETNARGSVRGIRDTITNAHYTVEGENITMSTDLEKQIGRQIAQLSTQRIRVKLERPRKEALARSLKPQATSITMQKYLDQRDGNDLVSMFTPEIWNMIGAMFSQWFDKMQTRKKRVFRYELQISHKSDLDKLIQRLIQKIDSTQSQIGEGILPDAAGLQIIEGILTKLGGGVYVRRGEIRSAANVGDDTDDTVRDILRGKRLPPDGNDE